MARPKRVNTIPPNADLPIKWRFVDESGRPASDWRWIGGPAEYFVPFAVRIGRKPHVCVTCKQTLEIGEFYVDTIPASDWWRARHPVPPKHAVFCEKCSPRRIEIQDERHAS